MEFDNLHQILRSLYGQMMPLCGDMAGVAKGIAGLGALFYVAYRVWQSLARAEPIDMFPMLRPFAIGLCIMFFPTVVLGTVNSVLSPVVQGTHAILEGQTTDIAAYQKQRDDLEYEARVREGLFREDLFHRLNVIRLRLPPLRERSEDIAALADHFLAEAAKNLKTERKHLKPEALDFIRRFPFPGNVRQLENLCNWLTVMAPSQWIRTEDLPDEFLRGEAAKDAVKGGAEGEWTSALKDEIRAALTTGAPEVMAKFTRDFECAVFRAALDFTHGRKVEAAQKLGVGRNTLTRKIQELGL